MNLETLTQLQARRGMYKWLDNKPRRFGEWIVTTDGHGMLAIRSTEECEIDDLMAKSGIPMIEAALGSIELPLAPLKEALGVDPDEPWCAKCSNTGLFDCNNCEGYGAKDCECDECGDSHTYKCKECSGRGKLRCECGHKTAEESFEAFVIDDVPFDKTILRYYMGVVQAETYRFAGHHPLRLGGDDWRMIIMPMNMYDQTKPVTRFEMATAAEQQ